MKVVFRGTRLKEFFILNKMRKIMTPDVVRGYKIYGNLEEIDDNAYYLMLENDGNIMIVEKVKLETD